jgi:hypothetical protein
LASNLLELECKVLRDERVYGVAMGERRHVAGAFDDAKAGIAQGGGEQLADPAHGLR